MVHVFVWPLFWLLYFVHMHIIMCVGVLVYVSNVCACVVHVHVP